MEAACASGKHGPRLPAHLSARIGTLRHRKCKRKAASPAVPTVPEDQAADDGMLEAGTVKLYRNREGQLVDQRVGPPKARSVRQGPQQQPQVERYLELKTRCLPATGGFCHKLPWTASRRNSNACEF